MLLIIWNIISKLRHFENEKFSQKYVIEYIILCCNLIYLYIIQLRFIENKYFHSWIAKDKDITFHTRVTPRMNKRVMIDTISKDIDEETQSTN